MTESTPKTSFLKIIEEKNVIDDHLLDIIGNEFKFDQEKGLAEWLKNSVDAYIRLAVSDPEQFVIFRFEDGKGSRPGIIECIDFGGMSHTDIEKAFKRWGDPEAAKRGLKKRTYGGHGNGGKFYMRQMFEKSHFVTYRDGVLNIFGFSQKKKYGFADGYKNRKMKPREALRVAGIATIGIPKKIERKVLSGQTGFTVVRGIGPVGMKQKIRVERIVDKFRNHPQSRRILDRINVSIIYNGKYIHDPLRPDELSPLPAFQDLKLFTIPEKLPSESSGEKEEVVLANAKFSQGNLVLRTSEEALGRGGRLAELNRIDFVGGIGVIASYQLFELGVRNFPQAAFIYGECTCPILEDPDNDCVSNDRTKLVDNESTRTLRKWCAEKIDELAAEIGAAEQKERNEQTKKVSSEFNEILNKWKDKFMNRVFSQLFGAGGTGSGEGTGEGSVRRRLEFPENGLQFTFAAAEIPLDQSWPLTLKAAVPEPFPVGTVISLSSSNAEIELEENKATIKSDLVRLTEEGERVAILDVRVIGKRVGEESEIVARAGKRSAIIRVKVVQSKKGGAKKPRYPRILLSGQDSDPLNLSSEDTVILSTRDPLVFQRPQDVSEGIYWINTSTPLAESILRSEQGGAESTRWRDFLFQRYIDIFVKEALYQLQKKEPDNFRAEIIDNQIMGELIRKVHEAAAVDLQQFLFETTYTPAIDKDESK